MPTPAQPVGSLNADARFEIWKDQHVPLLYDWLSSRTLVWPHEALRWGSLSPSENRSRERTVVTNSTPSITRALYLAERTGPSKRDPNTLLHFDVKVTPELSCKPQDIAKPWLDEAVVLERADQMSTRSFWLRKRIIHPGEVNRIRLAAPGVVVTHTDNPHLFVWDFNVQPDRKKDDMTPSVPTLTLVGHHGNADYALDVAPPQNAENDAARADTWIVSGGSDCSVLIWTLGDYQSMGTELMPRARMAGGQNISPDLGHTDIVEDVSFNSHDRNIVVSVGRDSAMMLWDARTSTRPTSTVRKAHTGDINCCDASGTDPYLVITGGSDHLIRVWDRRYLTNSLGERKPTRTLHGHSDQVTNVMWNKYVPGILASGGEDGQVLLWNTKETDRRPAFASGLYSVSPELMFRHVGHTQSRSKIVDFEWHPSESDPWCIASLSATLGEGGSTVQIWRISDLIYREKEEVAADLRQHARSRVY